MKSLGFASTALLPIGATMVQTYPNSYGGEFGLVLGLAAIVGFVLAAFG